MVYVSIEFLRSGVHPFFILEAGRKVKATQRGTPNRDRKESPFSGFCTSHVLEGILLSWQEMANIALKE